MERAAMRGLEPVDVGERASVAELADDVVLDLALARVTLEQRVALVVVVGEQQVEDVSRIDDRVVRRFFVFEH
jgi:hypothetical protein